MSDAAARRCGRRRSAPAPPVGGPGAAAWRRPAPLLDAAVGEAAAAGAQYADVRLSETQELRLYAVSGRAPDERLEGSLGLGVRVLVDGVWGFASLPLREAGDAALAARLAVRNAAAAAAGSPERVTLPPRPPESGRYQTQARIDPFAVSAAVREQVVADALAAAARRPGWCGSRPGSTPSASTGTSPAPRARASTSTSSSPAAWCRPSRPAALVQRRSYPNSFHGNTAAAGWEYVEDLRLAAAGGPGRRRGRPAAHAPRCAEPGRPIAGDRARPARAADPRVGRARARAGPDPRRRGQLRRPLVHRPRRRRHAAVRLARGEHRGRRDRPRHPGQLHVRRRGHPDPRAPCSSPRGSCTNFLSSRDSAARIGAESTGAARSDGWGFLPLCFATNVFLEPGTASLDELLDRMGDGYYLDDNKSWSIDSQRLNFQFGTEVAWEVRGGQRGRLVRDFSYGGITPQFWGSAEAVAGRPSSAPSACPAARASPRSGASCPTARRPRCSATSAPGWPDGCAYAAVRWEVRGVAPRAGRAVGRAGAVPGGAGGGPGRGRRRPRRDLPGQPGSGTTPGSPRPGSTSRRRSSSARSWCGRWPARAAAGSPSATWAGRGRGGRRPPSWPARRDGLPGAADPARRGRARGRPRRSAGLWHDATAAWDEGARSAQAGRIMDAARAAGGTAAGVLTTAVTELAVVTSAGPARPRGRHRGGLRADRPRRPGLLLRRRPGPGCRPPGRRRAGRGWPSARPPAPGPPCRCRTACTTWCSAGWPPAS